MQNISNICEKIGLNLLPSQQFPPSFISASIKGNNSISTLLPSLNNYGYYLHPSNLIEPVSPGGSSPCYSNHNENDPPCVEREHEYSLHEMGRMFMDGLAVGDTALPPDTVNSIWLLVHGLHEKHYIDEFLGLMRKALNPKFKDIRIVNYKGKQSILLEFFDVHATQMVFMCLKNDPILKPFMHSDWHILTLYIKSQEFSQLPPFNGVVVINLPVACTVNTIKGLIQAHCPGAISIHVEMPVVIGEAFCTFIRTPSLEDAELICIGLNALPTRTGELKAALHPDCDIRHTDPSKDPFYELKSSYRRFPFHNPMMYNHHHPPPDPRFQFHHHPPHPHHPHHPHQFHQSYQEEASFVRRPFPDRRGGNFSGPGPRDDYHWQRREEMHHIPNGLSHKETGRILQHENFKRDSRQHENFRRDNRSEKSSGSRYSKSSRHSRMQEPYDPDNQEIKNRYMQATYNKPHKRAPYNPYLNTNNSDEKVIYPEIEAQEVADFFKPAKERNTSRHSEARIPDPRDSILVKEESHKKGGIFQSGQNDKNDVNQWSDLFTKTWHHKPSEAPPIKDLMDQHSQYHSQASSLQDNIQKVSEMVTPSGKYTVVTNIFKSDGEEPEKVQSHLPYQRSNSVQVKSQNSKTSAIEEEEPSGQSFLRRSHSDTNTEYPASKYHSLDFIPPHHPVVMGDRKISMESESSNRHKTVLKKQVSFMTSPSVGQYNSDEDEQDPNISVVIREVNSDRSGSDSEMKNWKSANFEIFIDAGSIFQEEPRVKLEAKQPLPKVKVEPYIIPKAQKPKPLVQTEPLKTAQATQQSQILVKKEFVNTTPKQPEPKAKPLKITPQVTPQPAGNQGFIPFNDRLIFSSKPNTVIPVQIKPPPPSFNIATTTLPLQDSVLLSQKSPQSAQTKDPRLKFQVKQLEEEEQPKVHPKPTMEIEQNKPALEKDPRLRFQVKQLEEEIPNKTPEKPTATPMAMEIEQNMPIFDKISVKQEPVIEPPPPKLLLNTPIKPKLEAIQEESTTKEPTKPLPGSAIMPKLEASQESTTEPSPKLLSGVVLMPRLELGKSLSEPAKKKKSRFSDNLEEFKSENITDIRQEDAKVPNVFSMQVESIVASKAEIFVPAKKKPSRFSTSLSSDSVSTEATQPLPIVENQTNMIEEPKEKTETPKIIDSHPTAVNVKQEPNLPLQPEENVQNYDPNDDPFQKLNSHLLSFVSNQSTPAKTSTPTNKENPIAENLNQLNSVLMPPPSLSTRKENESVPEAETSVQSIPSNKEPLKNQSSGRKSLDEIYRQFCEEEGIKDFANHHDAELQDKIIPKSEVMQEEEKISIPQNQPEEEKISIPHDQPEETAIQPSTSPNIIEELPKPVIEPIQSASLSESNEQSVKEEHVVPIKVAVRKSKFTSIPSPPRVKTLIHEKEEEKLGHMENTSSHEIHHETSSPTNHLNSNLKQDSNLGKFIPGSIFIDRPRKLFQNGSPEYSRKREGKFTQKKEESLNQKRSHNELLPPTPLPKGYTWKRNRTPQAFIPLMDNNALVSLALAQSLMGQPQDISDPTMRPPFPAEGPMQNLLFPELPLFLSYSHSNQPAPAFYDPEKPSEFASSDLQIEEIPQSNNHIKQNSAFHEPEKPSGEFAPSNLQIEEIPQSHDQSKLTFHEPEKPNDEFSSTEQSNDQTQPNPEKTNDDFRSNDLQIEETPQSDDQKKLMAEYWDFKKALGLEEQDEDQMSIEPEGPPPMIPEEESPEPEGTPPMIPEIPEEGSPESPPPMFPEETPEGTPPMLPEGPPEYDEEAIGDGEDPQPTKKVIRDGLDFNALAIHHRVDRENSQIRRE